MRSTKYLLIFLICIVSLASCRKIEQLPPAPLIRFNSFTVFDTLTLLGKYKAGRLDFYFEDGDGDLGLEAPSGASGTDTTNMFLTLYRKKGGKMVVVTDNFDALLPYPSYRIPFMERPGVNKILKGTVTVTFLYTVYSPTDTIKYDYYIKDRGSNESNLESTGEIVVAVNKIYLK